ncbi:MAG TPA: hypothetical protein VM165_02170 [Planctomycetaceae bacterium]|nr:hypothetical protein [Planctomycetaceae bacterium]
MHKTFGLYLGSSALCSAVIGLGVAYGSYYRQYDITHPVAKQRTAHRSVERDAKDPGRIRQRFLIGAAVGAVIGPALLHGARRRR